MKRKPKFSIGQLLASGNIEENKDVLLGIIVKATRMADGFPTYDVQWMYSDEILEHKYIDEEDIEGWHNAYNTYRKLHKL